MSSSTAAPARVVAVDSLVTVLEALDEIVEQGEGSLEHDVWDGDHDMFHAERVEVAHFYRFQERQLGRDYQHGDALASGPTGDPMTVDWAGVPPMHRNPRTADQAPGGAIRVAEEQFNHVYTHCCCSSSRCSTEVRQYSAPPPEPCTT